MEKARRRRVPAFGEWNYHHHHDKPEAAAAAAEPAPATAWYATPEPEACSDVWFRYSPPPPKKHTRRRPEPEDDPSRQHQRARPSSGTCTAKGGGASRRVVRPVDEDLYQVPPPEFAVSHRAPRKKRSLWMGCLGLNSCVDD